MKPYVPNEINTTSCTVRIVKIVSSNVPHANPVGLQSRLALWIFVVPISNACTDLFAAASEVIYGTPGITSYPWSPYIHAFHPVRAAIFGSPARCESILWDACLVRATHYSTGSCSYEPTENRCSFEMSWAFVFPSNTFLVWSVRCCVKSSSR